MAETHSLDVQLRTITGKKVARLRRDGLVPATAYGKGVTPMSLQIDARSFNTMLRQVGRTALVELNIPGQPAQSAFIHAVQRHPVSRSIIHVDFRVVNLREDITVEVPINLTGESLAVERDGAVVNQVLTTLQIRSLPGNLPQHIDIDLGILDDISKSIHVRDLPTSNDYHILNDPDELIVALTASRMQQDEADATAAEEAGTSAVDEAGEADQADEE